MSSLRVRRRRHKRTVIRYIERALHAHEAPKSDAETPVLVRNILRGRSSVLLDMMNARNPFAFAAAWARVHGGEL